MKKLNNFQSPTKSGDLILIDMLSVHTSGNNLDKYKILNWELEPGDAVAFHMLTLHSGLGSNRLRRVFSVRFLGDDIRHAPRTWKTSPEFPGLSKDLPSGVQLDHKLFPKIWPKKN